MSTLTTLTSFNGIDGAAPTNLIIDAAGNLIGATQGGGATGVTSGFPNGDGTVFEILNTSTGYASVPTTLVSFDGANGGGRFDAGPQSGLIANVNGDLFGTTYQGGVGSNLYPGGYGTVFEVPYTSGSYASVPTVLVSFNGMDGFGPHASLIADASGDLFGTTGNGGPNDVGVVFEIPNTTTGYASMPTTLVSFDGENGELPESGLIADAQGDLFGTTYEGGATFGGPNYNGGVSGYGTVFEILNTGTGYASEPTALVSFDGANGEYPIGGLIADAQGDLFGTTVGGGAFGDGTVFEILKTATGYASVPTTLVSFDGENGELPGSLIADAQGDLFGTTAGGGANGYVDGHLGDGTIFEIAKIGNDYAGVPTTLISFDGSNGQDPSSSLTVDAVGDLFGSTQSGGSYGDGTVFELTGTGFQVTENALCFLAGTLITTPTGGLPVERLAPGDQVVTMGGAVRCIVWVGHGRVLVTGGRRNAAAPVLVRRGALSDNVPHLDLRITKGHSLYIDEVLIPVEFLVNFRSIVWDDQAREVSIYHVELATHEVLLANGAPAESYRDDGNRWLFRNGNTGWDQPPKSAFAPVLTGGPAVDVVWRRLLDRSGPRPSTLLTDDPDLHLLADGRRVDGAQMPDGYHVFSLPYPPSVLRILSRAGSPAELGQARDPRRLGVAVRQIRLWQSSRVRLLVASDELLAEGFHSFEPDNGYRWTDGNAVLPLELFQGLAGECQIEVLIGGTTRYPRCNAAAGAASSQRGLTRAATVTEKNQEARAVLAQEHSPHLS